MNTGLFGELLGLSCTGGGGGTSRANARPVALVDCRAWGAEEREGDDDTMSEKHAVASNSVNSP